VSDVARAQEVLATLLAKMGLETTIDVREEGDRVVLDVKGPETGLVIGKKGQTLEALQYLVGRIIHKGVEGETGQRAILIDAEGYRARREEALVEMARRLGEKATRTGRTVEMNPMSPHDRRIVHLTLADTPGLATRSEGEGIYRRLLIVPDGAKE
jgi:spoIIIJ-associated protein